MPLSRRDLFSRTDDGAGGALQTFKRRLKFNLRHVWYRREIQHLDRLIEGRAVSAILHTDVHVLSKAMRPYLWSGLAGPRRFQAQRLHLEWLLDRFSAEEVQAFHERGHTELAGWMVGERRLSVTLCPARGLSREGDLELHLNLDGEAVKRAAFSVLPADFVGLPGAGRVMVIGSMQGRKNGMELIRETTQLLERTKPFAVLLNALQGLAQAWELQAMVGVTDQGHAYAGYRSLSQRVGASYDQLWQELGAEGRLNERLWMLPLTWTPRPESEVESKKRSQLRRRNALRQQVLDSCAQAAAQLSRAG